MSSLVTQQFVRRLEEAALVTLGDSGQITHQIRQEAEDVLLSFRRSDPGFNDCRLLIENTTEDTVRYQGVVGLREAALKHWMYTDQTDRNALKTFTMTYTSNNLHLPGYLIAALTQALAVMLKLEAVRQNYANPRDDLYKNLKDLVFHGNSPQQLLACSVISNLMTEFAINQKSSHMGITMEQHWICKKQFEKKDLKIIFELTFRVINTVLSMSNVGPTKETYNILLNFLKILEHLLMWTFSSVQMFSKRTLYFLSDRDKIAFEPPADWEKDILNCDNIRSIFSLNQKCRQTEDLSVLSVSCLRQVSSLEGEIIGNDEKKCDFLRIFVQHFLQSYKDVNYFSYEAQHIAHICLNLITNYKINIWQKSPTMKELFREFVNGFTNITCIALLNSIEEANIGQGDQIYLDSFDVLLDGWTTLVLSVGLTIEPDLMTLSSKRILEHYVKSHISCPEGWRSSSQDEEIDELQENDTNQFSSQLQSIGALARLSLDATLGAVVFFLQSRILTLEGVLRDIESSNCTNLSHMDDLYEDIHWLVLIASFILCDISEGETVVIPPEIMKFSISQKTHINRDLTLKMLGSPETYHHLVANALPQNFDTSTQVVAIMLRLCHVITQSGRSVGIREHVSPELITDSLFFLKHWAATYVFFDESYYDEISPIFCAAYGRDSEGARWCINFVVNYLCSVLEIWSAEANVLEYASTMLVTLVKNDITCSHVAKSESFWRLAHAICAGEETFRHHPPKTKQHIVTSIVIVGTSDMNMYREKYWESTMGLILKRYQAEKVNLIAKKSLDSVAMDGIMLIFDLFCGIADGSRPQNCQIIFNFMSEILSDGGRIIEVCHGGNHNVVLSLLTIFSHVVQNQISFLIESNCRLLYEWTLSVLRSHAAVTSTMSRNSDDDDRFSDLSVIFEILIHLLDRDFIDFSETEETTLLTVRDNVEKIEVSDVVLYGMSYIFPTVDTQILSHPNLCTQYYKLVSYFCELYPAKIYLFPTEVFVGFMQLIKYGLTSNTNDICRYCLDSIHSLYESSPGSQLSPYFASFVQLVFDALMLHAGDLDLLRSASETFFVLFRQNPNIISQLFESLVVNKSDPNDKQRLITQFGKFHFNTNELHTRDTKRKFIKIMEDVIFDVRGILWVK